MVVYMSLWPARWVVGGRHPRLGSTTANSVRGVDAGWLQPNGRDDVAGM